MITKSEYNRNTAKYWIGKKVKVVEELQNSLIVVLLGTIMEIIGKHGGFSLRGEKCQCCGIRPVINKVEPHKVCNVGVEQQLLPISRGENIFIPKKHIDMLHELADLDAEGDRNKMLIQLIEKHYKIKKDLQQWQSDDAIRRAIKDSFKKEEVNSECVSQKKK